MADAVPIAPAPQGWRRRGARRLAVFVVLVLLGLHALSGFFVLGPGERAVVERFGRPLNADAPAGPGLHYTWPWPIDRVRRVSTTRIERLALGYRGRTDPEAILWTNIVYEDERPMLTGHRVETADRPTGPAAEAFEHMQVLVNARVFVHYRVADPGVFLYHCQAPVDLLHAMAERLLRQHVAGRELFPMLSTDRDQLQDALHESLAARAEALGVAVVGVEIRDIHAPAPVAGAFRDVVSATEDYETMVNHGRGYQIDTVERARTRGEELAAWADGQRERVLARSRAGAQALAERLRVYRTQPAVARSQLTLDALGRALKDVRKVLIPGREGSSLSELWLMDGVPGTAAPVAPDARRPSVLRPRAKRPTIPEKEL